MAIITFTNGTVANATEVNTNFDMSYRSKNALFNRAGINTYQYDLIGSTRTNVDYDGTSAGTSGGTTVFVEAVTNDKIYGIAAYDLMNNSSVDTGIWTVYTFGIGGAVTENADRLRCSTGNDANAEGRIESNDLSSAKASDFRILFFTSGSTPDIVFSDGSAQIGISGTNGLHEVRYNQSADTFDYLRDGSSISTGTSLASLTGSVRIRVGADGANLNVDVYGMFWDGASEDARLIVDNISVSSIPSNLIVGNILLADIAYNSGTITPAISTDNSTWETITDDALGYGYAHITTPGKNKIFRVVFNSSSTLSNSPIETTGVYTSYYD